MATKTTPKRKTTVKLTGTTSGTKLTKTETIYQTITDKIVSALAANIVPWKKSWTIANTPRNFESGRTYSGVNLFLLAISSAVCGFSSPFWMTFNQAKNLGGTVRKGEKGTSVVFWKIYRAEVQPGQPYDFEENGKLYKRVFTLQNWTVFNLSQVDMPVETVDKYATEFLNPEAIVRPDMEAVFADMPNPPKRSVGSPAYFPLTDTVSIPSIKSFTSEDMYYHTLAHEIVHSTGHTSRLDRKDLLDPKSRFGTESYSREELTAEIGACLVSGRLGIDVETITTETAAYIKGWTMAIKNDPTMIVAAAARATKAAAYIFHEIPEPVEEAA